VRERVRESGAMAATTDAWYYGLPGGERRIGDRTGGTFEEADRLAHAVVEEVLLVRDGIEPGEVTGIRTRQIAVAATPAGEPVAPGKARRYEHVGASLPSAHAARALPLPRVGAEQPLEVMTVAIDGPSVLLVGEPGEVFARTGAQLRRRLRHAGTRAPFVVGYANGWRTYLPPADAFPDGGYEVDWARRLGLSETLQDDLAATVLGARPWAPASP
jgi:hypothetical protein